MKGDNHFLHNLDRIPEGASVSILGKKGRNNRFQRVVQTLRPDLSLEHVIHSKDRDPVGGICSEDPVLLEELRSLDFILITSSKHRPILSSLRKWGLHNCLFVDQSFCHPFLQFEGMKREHEKGLQEAERLFDHESDRVLFDLVRSAVQVRSNLEDVYGMLVKLYARSGRQYFDFINPAAIGTVVEGGVADGRNTVEFLGAFPEPVIYGFDPDTEYLETSYFRAYLESHPRVHLEPWGLWGNSGRLFFELDKPGSSHVSMEAQDGGEEFIDAIALDEFMQDRNIDRVDFIKMDIEGAELQALQGAKETLRAHRPQLAVCIYHYLEHHYAIPLFLAEHLKDYVFRVGHYSDRHVFSETVLYGIPRELYDQR